MKNPLILALALAATAAAQKPAKTEPRGVATVETVVLEGVAPLHRVGNLLLAGQPSAEALRTLASGGATAVLDLRRGVEQRGYDEAALTEELGLAYTELGFGGPDPLTDSILHDARALLREHRQKGEGDLVVHCASSNRVGAVWLTSRVLDEGVAWERALEEAHSVGLGSPLLEEAARLYVLGAGNQEFGRLKEELRSALPGVARTTVGQLAEEIAGDTPPVLIDARSAEEYAVSHLRGARRAETVDEALNLLQGVEPGRAVVVYCSVGYRSGYLARDLAARDVANVSNLEGSIFEWANTGHPVYRGDERVRVVHPYDEEWGRFLRRDLWAEPAREK